MQSTQQTTTDSLQGGAQLQQQDTSTQYQQTGGVGQDALGPEQYQKFDSLSVQGAPVSGSNTAVTAGTNSPEALLLIMLVAVCAGVVLLRKYFLPAPKQTNEVLKQEVTENSSKESSVAKTITKSSTKNKKKSNKKTSTAKKVKNPAKKSKKSSKKK